MTSAAIIAICIGVGYLVYFGLALFCRDAVRKFLDGFPRSSVAGKIFAAIALAWFIYVLHETNFGRFEQLRYLVYVIVAVGYYCLIKHLNELLAVRALGGIFILAGAPILDAIRWHESSWRLCITILMYLLIVKGMVLVVSPYRFRHGVDWMYGVAMREKMFTFSSGALGALFAIIGLIVL